MNPGWHMFVRLYKCPPDVLKQEKGTWQVVFVSICAYVNTKNIIKEKEAITKRVSRMPVQAAGRG